MSAQEQSGTLVPVWFVSPEGFTPIPLTGDSENRAESYAQFLDQLYPDVDPVEKLTLISANELFVQRMLSDGAIYFASLLYRLEDDSLCSGMASAFMVDGPVPGGMHFAERLVAKVPDRFPGEQVDAGVVATPAGRAALIARDVITPSLFSAISPDDNEEGKRQRQLEAYIPFPSGSAYLHLVMGTPDLHAWEDFLPLFGGFIAGVSFSPPVPPRRGGSNVSGREVADWARRDFG